MSILIVDDTAFQREALGTLLATHGYTNILCAASAVEALGQLCESVRLGCHQALTSF